MTGALRKTVESALASKRLGSPVFIRMLLGGAGNPEEDLLHLGLALEAVRAWMDQEADLIHGNGSLEAGNASLLLRFPSGATAAIGLAGSSLGAAAIDLMLLGARGALYHDGLCPGPGSAQAARAGDPAIRDLIRRALASPQPIRMEPGRAGG